MPDSAYFSVTKKLHLCQLVVRPIPFTSMSRESFLLVPPSEGKRPGGGSAQRPDSFKSQLADARAELLAVLRQELANIPLERASKLLKARGDLLDLSLRSMRACVAQNAPQLPAWRRYSGVVWEHLDPATLEGAARKRLLVPSGLYGLNRGTDQISDYRLTMNVSLKGLGKLASFWREPVTEALCSCAKGGAVYNLLPQEHAAAVDFERVSDVAEVRHVSFLTADGSSTAGHAAKAMKGIVARYLLEQGEQGIGSLQWEGWRVRRVDGGLDVLAPRQSLVSKAKRGQGKEDLL